MRREGAKARAAFKHLAAALRIRAGRLDAAQQSQQLPSMGLMEPLDRCDARFAAPPTVANASEAPKALQKGRREC